jgi:two-component sensor histidine kinase/DNA-binding NarL/FixJ family response regulator
MDIKPVKVLVIEDNPGDVRLIREFLINEPETRFEVECVSTLKDGIKYIRKGGFDEILLDMSLPDCRGLKTLEKIAKAAPEYPIVILTGLDDEALGATAVQKGAQDYLMKNQMDSTSLVRALRYAIERKRIEIELVRSGKFNEQLLDSVPFPSMLIRKDRTILAANKIARESGALIGGLCWLEFGKGEYIPEDDKEYIKNQEQCPHIDTKCVFCLADEAVKEGKEYRNPDIEAFGRIWDMFWIPLHDDVYLHYSIDITERKQAEEIIKKSLREKETMLKEIHHRVKNNFQLVSNLLILQSHTTEDKNVHKILEVSQDRIQSMALVHEMLYQSRDLATIGFAKYIRKLSRSLFKSYSVDESRIKLELDIEDVQLPEQTAIQCGLIINELIANSLKHAFGRRRQGEISVKLHKTTSGQIELIVADNGKGIPDDFDISTTDSLGLHLVSIIAEKQLRGKIEVSNHDGALFKIIFRPRKEKT